MPRLLVALLVLAAASPAAAAENRVVARDRDEVLSARRSAEGLCIHLERPETGRPFRGGKCGPAPLSPFRPLVMRPYRSYSFAAAVPPDVRFADATTHKGQVRYRTRKVKGLPGRFVLIRTPPDVSLVRFRDANRKLLSVIDGPNGYIGFQENAVDITEGAKADASPVIAPLPGAPGRFQPLACLSLARTGGGDGYCDYEDEGQSGIVVQSDCGQPDLVGGVLEPGATAVRLTLGTGAELTIPGTALTPIFGGRTAYGRLLPPEVAIREAEALDANGATVARALIGSPPSDQPCAGEDQAYDGANTPLLQTPPPAAATAAEAGGHRLVVAEQGNALCVGLDTVPTAGCAAPPVDADGPALYRLGTTVGGVLGNEATTVTLHLDQGPDVTVPTTDGPGYRGRWAGRVRFLATAVPPNREVRSATVHAANGHLIGRRTRPPRRVEQTERIVVDDAGLGLKMTRRGHAQPCLKTTTLPSPSLCTHLHPGQQIDGGYLPYEANITVACDPRRAIAWGRFPDKLPTPTVTLQDGTSIATKRVPLRGNDAFFAFLPDAGVSAFKAPGKHHVPLKLPAPADQCGYSIARSL